MNLARAFAITLSLHVLLHSPALGGQMASGGIRVSAVDAKLQEGIAQVGLSVLGTNTMGSVRASTGSTGDLSVLGLPPGAYEVRFEKEGYCSYIVGPVLVETGRASTVVLEMAGRTDSCKEPILREWNGAPEQAWAESDGTALDRGQIDMLPAAQNIWALLENQEPATVTDRVDEGGTGTGSVALAGVRGGTWTQNGYYLDGLNITDPDTPGRPLVYPDYGGMREFRVSSGLLGGDMRYPGASFLIASRNEGRQARAGLETYYLGERLQSRNLEEQSATSATTQQRFRRFGEVQVEAALPLTRSRRWSWFTSFGSQRVSREVTGFIGTPNTSVVSTLMRVDGTIGERDSFSALLTGQIIDNSNIGAAAGLPASATLHGNDRYDAAQAHWTRRFGTEAVADLSFGISHASLTDTFQGNVSEVNQTRLFGPTLAGAAPLETDAARIRMALAGHLQAASRMGGGGSWRNVVDAGFDFGQSFSTVEDRVFDDLRLFFYPDDTPLQVARFNTPSRTKQRLREWALFLDERALIAGRFYIRLALRLDAANAYLPSQTSGAGNYAPEREFDGREHVVSWTTLEPAGSLAVPIRLRSPAVRLFAGFGRYPHVLPASYAGFANPNGLGGELFEWMDSDHDGVFQAGEGGRLLRVFGSPCSSVAPDLKRPYTDELVVGADGSFGPDTRASLRLFHRHYAHRVETINVGVPPSAYLPVQALDPGEDGIGGTPDDRRITVFDQDPRTLGADRYLLTNPRGLDATSEGFEATVRTRLNARGFLAASFMAYRSEGVGNPGNGELENDPGVIGRLFDDPNAQINARGRFFFDRAYTAKLLGWLRGPGAMQFGWVFKYYDGLPFGRKLIVTGLEQGPVLVMATPRGQPGGFRTQFHLTTDLRVSRRFEHGRLSGAVMVDFFNILNQSSRLRENDMTGPDFPLRLPTEVLNPRVIRLGLRLNI